MFAQLSSYSIQFIREINDTDILMGGAPHTRYGNVREYSENKIRIVHSTRFFEGRVKGKDRIEFDNAKGFEINSTNGYINVLTEVHHRVEMNAENTSGLTGKMIHRQSFMEPSILTRDPVTGDWKEFPAGQPELFLTQEQFQNLKFINV